MDMDSPTVWPGRDQSMVVGEADDFQQYLDLSLSNLGDGLSFGYNDFDSANGHGMMHGSGNVLDTSMDGHGGDVLGQKDVIMGDSMTPMTSAPAQSSIPSTPMGIPTTGPSIGDIDAQIHFLQQQRQQQQQLLERQREEQRRGYYSQNSIVPPTPNSMELQGAHQYHQADQMQHQHQQSMYERYHRMKDDMASFTPLVSPAVTPLETQFNLAEFPISGAYFSPISSPAMVAQPDRSQHGFLYSEKSTSPADMGPDLHAAAAATPASVAKKARGPAKTSRSRTVRQSPIVKPITKRRGGSSATITAQSLSDIMEPKTRERAQNIDSSQSGAGSTEDSERESISPEHLSDMAPPPLPQPGSVRPSPFLPAGRSPATPASLMRMPKSSGSEKQSPAANTGDMSVDQTMEELELPEAAGATDERPQLARLDTTGDATPTLNVTPSATPNFQTLPSPGFARPSFPASVSATQSPMLSAVGSPNPAITPGSIRKTPQLGPKGRKRSSVHVSPALRPRISPSIKPLLPGGANGSADDTARLLLASKSNYQNIIEGTTLPGVSYPTELSTSITHKRTSHKIAEQGRRNRINSALQEIASLLPQSSNDGKGSGSGEGGETNKTSQAANSKASTVELAIEYIKQLKTELADANRRAAEAESKLAGKPDEPPAKGVTEEAKSAEDTTEKKTTVLSSEMSTPVGSSPP